MRVASTYRTSANVDSLGSRERVRELGADAALRVGTCPDLVEAEQSSADDRRGCSRPDDDCRCMLDRLNDEQLAAIRALLVQLLA
jgi:hypothetical protein